MLVGSLHKKICHVASFVANLELFQKHSKQVLNLWLSRPSSVFPDSYLNDIIDDYNFLLSQFKDDAQDHTEEVLIGSKDLVDIYYKTKRYESAIELYQLIVNIKAEDEEEDENIPFTLDVYYSLALCYKSLDQLQPATQILKQASFIIHETEVKEEVGAKIY